MHMGLSYGAFHNVQDYSAVLSGAVAFSSIIRYAYASSAEFPHISSDGFNPAQAFGLSGDV